LTGVFAALLLTSGRVLASGQALDVGLLADKSVTLTKHFGVLEDPAGKLEIADVASASALQAFKTGQANAWSLNYGLTQSAYWLKLDLKNTDSIGLTGCWNLPIPGWPPAFRLYQATSAGGYSVVDTGYMKPFSTRGLCTSFLCVSRSQWSPIRRPPFTCGFGRMSIWRSPAVCGSGMPFTGTSGLTTAAMHSISAWPLPWWCTTSCCFYRFDQADTSCMVCFGISSTLSIAAISGLAIEYLWGNSPYWSNIAASVGYSTSLALGLMFMRSMIGTAKLVPRLDWALQAGVAIHLVLAFGGCNPLHLVYQATVGHCRTDGLAGDRDRGDLRTPTRQERPLFHGGVCSHDNGSSREQPARTGPDSHHILFDLWHPDRVHHRNAAARLRPGRPVPRDPPEKELAQKQALLAQKLMVESLQSSERDLESRVKERTGELKLLNARLETLSATDGLTGLANRRHFDEVLDTEWRRSCAAVSPLLSAFWMLTGSRIQRSLWTSVWR
jgi:hypothetical protein